VLLGGCGEVNIPFLGFKIPKKERDWDKRQVARPEGEKKGNVGYKRVKKRSTIYEGVIAQKTGGKGGIKSGS